MEIFEEQKEDVHILFIEEDQERLGELYYRMRENNRMLIEHTRVSEKLKGKGIGKQLVDHAVGIARRGKFKIIPLCAFTKSVFQKFKGYEDVQ